MLPEIGAAELLVIAAVALIVVGPKDLPLLMRKLARFLSRMRAMAAEFRNSFDEIARQSELDELRREVEALRTGRFADPVTSDIDRSFRDIDRGVRGSDGDMRPLEPAAAEPPPAAAEEPARETAPEVKA